MAILHTSVWVRSLSYWCCTPTERQWGGRWGCQRKDETQQWQWRRPAKLQVDSGIMYNVYSKLDNVFILSPLYAFPYQTLTEVEVSCVAVVFVMNWAHCANRFVFRLALLCLSGVGTWQWTFNPWLVSIPGQTFRSPITSLFFTETKGSSQRSRGHRRWRVVQQSELVVRMQDCVSYLFKSIG